MDPELSADDERRICAVLLRYATAIDTRDWTLFRACFTDDVDADYGEFGHWTDAAGFTAAMRDMHAAMGPTLHQMSNLVPAASPGGATARSYVDALLMTGPTPAAFTQAHGYYEDRLVSTAAGWRIQARRFVPVRVVTG